MPVVWSLSHGRHTVFLLKYPQQHHFGTRAVQASVFQPPDLFYGCNALIRWPVILFEWICDHLNGVARFPFGLLTVCISLTGSRWIQGSQL